MTPTNIIYLGYKTASEVRTAAVSFVPKLPSGVLLTGTPTITEVTSSDLTLANKAVSTGALTIDDTTVATGKALTFKISGGTAGTSYLIQMSCATDAAVPENPLIAVARIDVIADTD